MARRGSDNVSSDARLKDIIVDVLLVEDSEYVDENGPEQIETWDSLASVSLATRIAETFDLEVTPEELTSWQCIGDIKSCLRSKGYELK